MRNYSDTGALLEFRDPAPSAHMFRLVIADKNIDVLCQVRHRAPRTLGISFVGGTVERFVEVFNPQPLIPAEQVVKAIAAEGARTPSISNRSLRREMFERGPNAADNDANGPSEPMALAAATDAATEAAPATAMPALLAALTLALDAIPEYAAAGFRIEPSEDGTELAIFQRTARRGVWHHQSSRLLFTPSGIGLEPCEAGSVDEARLHTMRMVLVLLERRRRVAQPDSVNVAEATSAASPL